MAAVPKILVKKFGLEERLTKELTIKNDNIRTKTPAILAAGNGRKFERVELRFVTVSLPVVNISFKLIRSMSIKYTYYRMQAI